MYYLHSSLWGRNVSQNRDFINLFAIYFVCLMFDFLCFAFCWKTWGRIWNLSFRRFFSNCWRWRHCVGTLCHHAVMEANLWSVFCCVFQLGDPRGLHHHTPSACCQGETVHREHRGAGAGGQRTGQGNTSVCFLFTRTEILWSQHSHRILWSGPMCHIR